MKQQYNNINDKFEQNNYENSIIENFISSKIEENYFKTLQN